ncbi:MAG TPA: GNAT family N-acetyltransferase, partial [Candidatus Lokiarchaeia archaeon]|nr:GNAT family N-acetyltransferase [Candidatus Lokiarchaeia archaeon]
TVQVNDEVQILDIMYSVKDLQATFWVAGVPKTGIELTASGPETRFYDNQNWTGTFTDTWYFDPTTGYALSERYTEQNAGLYPGYYGGLEPTTWTWYVQYDINTASFVLPVNGLLLAGVIIGIVALIVGIIGGIVALASAAHWRIIVESFPAYGPVRISRVRRLEDFPSATNRATDHFEPFLEDFAKKTLLQGGRVAVALWTNTRDSPPQQELIGAAYYTKEEDIGVIFCKNTNVTERLREYIKCKDFFSEVRHEVSKTDMQEMQSAFGRQVQPQAYNIFETYQLLELEVIAPVGYDTSSITLMREADLPAVIDVAKKVYQVPCKKSLTAQFGSGDIGFVARVKGHVVGFAFVTPNPQKGRNHTLTVLPEFRNKGLGTELLRARLVALAELGIPSVITEIADWNLPSLQVSNKFGFHKVGEMFVETARQQRIKKNIVRW